MFRISVSGVISSERPICRRVALDVESGVLSYDRESLSKLMLELSVPTTPITPELTWEVAQLFPCQGAWSDSSYLELTHDLANLVELTDGQLEVLEMPTTSHQAMVLVLVRYLSEFVRDRSLGVALMAPLRVQLRPGLFREPDVVFAFAKNQHLVRDDFWTGANLVMEVVSAGAKSRQRDLQNKRHEYAAAGIAEYWIIDPMTQSITVLELRGTEYQESGIYHAGESAASKLLEGFSLPTNEVLKAAG